MTAAEASWVRAVDLAFADRRFGAEVVDRCLGEARSYAEVPRLDGAGRLHASPTRVAWQGGVNLGKLPQHRIALRIRERDGIEIACTCGRGGGYLCEHAVMVVVDLAIEPRLAEALTRGDPVEELVAGLPARRSAAVEERTLEARLERWKPARATEDLELDLEPSRPLASGSATHEERPLLLVRVRRPSSRAIQRPRELATAPLSPRDRRWFELCAPSAHQKDALVATRAQASMLLHLLRSEGPLAARTGGFRWPLRFSAEEVSPRAEAVGERLVARWVTASGAVVADAADALLFAGPFPYVWSESKTVFHPVAPEVDLDVALGLSVVPSLPLHGETAARVGRTLLGGARARGIALPPPEAFGLPPLEAPTFVLALRGSPLALHATLTAVYRAGSFDVRSGEAGAAGSGRDEDAESGALVALERAGFVADASGALVAHEERAVEVWQGGLEALRASTSPAFEIRIAESLARVKIGPPVTARTSVSVTSGWLDVTLDFTVASLKADVARVHAVLIERRRWVELSDGTLARISDEVAELVGELDAAGAGEASAGPWPGYPRRIAAHHLGRVERWVARFGDAEDDALPSLRTSLRALAVADEPELPAGLQASLRPYQRKALAWLQFLRALGAGGVLADDMGLGKTVVSLAFLAWCKERAEGTRRPSLVVCPTSLVGNWLAEAARFTPALVVTAVRAGSGASLGAALASSDVVVTTYGLLRRHEREIAAVPLRCFVLDEAQNVKNPEAETARAARRIGAEMRVALSGTPVENHLTELWSILAIVNPGMLGSLADFDARFAQPIAQRPDGPAGAQLRAVVRPFVLRRTKAQVLTDLPPKTEIDRTCTLDGKQKRRYDALAVAVRQSVKRDIEKRGFGASRLPVLTAILRLRQMACDPRLVDPEAPADAGAKRAVFLDVVSELVAESRRALVFSQFVGLLSLWREDLDRARIPYEYLDGSTIDRDAVVERFQRGSAPLFLISLKAGGAGLNLTAADTVIHCDPWWNPAVEDQATDRAHRPGQEAPVTVVRLLAEGTIEEKVAMLKAKKRELAEAVLGASLAGGDATDDDRTALRGLSAEDVDMLLGDDGLAETGGAAIREGDESDESDESDRPREEGEGPGPRDRPLTTTEIDELRAMARWLEERGAARKDLAKRVGVPSSRLALLMIGHRVRLSRSVAERLRAEHAAMRARFGYS